MQVKATIRVNGRPLRHAFVEHLGAVGAMVYMTDADGRIRSDDFDEGIESFTPEADIRILCQNPVVRVVDGANFNIGVWEDRKIEDGAIINLNTNAEQVEHYDILDRAWRAYQVVYRPLSYFQELSDPDFPLGRRSDLRRTKDQVRRIDLSYPDSFPANVLAPVVPLAYVEPTRIPDGFPLMHIKFRASDGRLFGEIDARSPLDRRRPTLIPQELAHALHFSHLDEDERASAQGEYVEFITSELFAGRAGTHAFDQRTSATVAFIEALDHYGARFSEFIRARQGGDSMLLRPEPVTAAIQRQFVEAEWLQLTRPAVPPIPGVPGCDTDFPPPRPRRTPLTPAERLLLEQGITRHGNRRPCLTGGDVEGAVYAAIFVDFALSVGLDFAASSYFRAHALTFGEYRRFINDHHPEHADALERARRFWGL